MTTRCAMDSVKQVHVQRFRGANERSYSQNKTMILNNLCNCLHLGKVGSWAQWA